MSGPEEAEPVPLDAALLARMPLPQPDEGDDKDNRGAVLVIAGCTETPGAALLAGVGALRAGAGKLQIGTCRSTAPLLATAVPEALVMALPESAEGGIDPAAMARLDRGIARARAVLLGPGMADEAAVAALLDRVMERLGEATLVLDAAAVVALRTVDRRVDAAILTPHAGEMAALLDCPKARVLAEAPSIAREAARRFGAVVALKGPPTHVAAPDGRLFRFDGGCVGLGTSGSGDTLAGIVAGLAARGATALEAALWGVHLHGAAGRRLAARVGPVGFLAREILDEIPSLLAADPRALALSV